MRISDWSSDVCSSDLDPDPVARKAKRRNRGQGIERLRPQRDDRERQRRGVQPLPARLVLRRGENGGVAHAKSVWIWRRIVSRIAAARSLDSPGSVTVLLCVPEVWTIRCDRPNQRRSEEHTSELQSLMRISYAVFCLKKKIKPTDN